jgi:16S rRNA (cytosine1402-N4)-methyltransferase
MLAEVLDALKPADGETHVDGTFGAGGYTRAILDASNCRVIAIDRDPSAIAAGQVLVEAYSGRLTLLEGRFGDLQDLLEGAGVAAADGIVLDIGVSSMQLDQAERGFSFMRDGPLDMRMAQSGPSAADLVNTLPPETLANIIYIFGEEPRSRAIAKAIVNAARRSAHHHHIRTREGGGARHGPPAPAGPHAPGHPHLPGAAHPCEWRTR